MLVILKAAVPVLLSGDGLSRTGTLSGSEPKVRLDGETTAAGAPVPPAPAVPVPERVTDCGLPVALSVRVRAAVRDPLAAGVKVTLIVQLAPAATLAPQLLVCAKSLGFVPVMAILVMLKVALPVLFRVTDLGRAGGAHGLAGEGEAGGGKASRLGT